MAQNEVEAGINRTAEYFKRGKIKIFSSCRNLIWELERYKWCEERETHLGVARPKPYKANDHLCDCLRYIIMSRPEKAITPQVERDIDELRPKDLLKMERLGAED